MIFSSQLGKLDGQTSEQAVKTIANHLRKVQEELEYRLGNLDSTNINEINTNETRMSGALVELISENENGVARLTLSMHEIQAEVADEINGLSSLVTQTAREIRAELENEVDGLNSTISQTALAIRTELSNELYNVNSSIQQTASEIRAEVESEISGVESSLSVRIGTIEGKVEDVEGNMSSLTQTTTSLTSQIQATNGDVSTLKQTVNSLSSTVTSQGSSISQVVQNSNAIMSVVQDLQTGQQASLKLSANGLIYNDNQGTVTINGSQVQANTVKVNTLYGSNVYFCDANGYPAADIEVTGSSSTYSQKVVLTSGAFQVETYGGSIYLHSMLGPSLLLGRRETNGPVYCQLTGGALLIDTDSYGPLSNRPSSGTYGQVYFALE